MEYDFGNQQWEGHHDADCRRVVICDCWQPGGASVEELLSQLPEDVIRPGFNKEDPGRGPPPSIPSAFHLQEGVSPGATSEESVKQRCVLSLKQ
jgi:hypothetical protein